jgi:hypothetical protein
VVILDNLRLANYTPTNKDASIPHMQDSNWKISLEESSTTTLVDDDLLLKGEKCSRSTDDDDEFVCLNPY